jgi:hypothetical protein
MSRKSTTEAGVMSTVVLQFLLFPPLRAASSWAQLGVECTRLWLALPVHDGSSTDDNDDDDCSSMEFSL